MDRGAWWTPGRQQSTGSQRVGHDWSNLAHTLFTKVWRIWETIRNNGLFQDTYPECGGQDTPSPGSQGQEALMRRKGGKKRGKENMKSSAYGVRRDHGASVKVHPQQHPGVRPEEPMPRNYSLSSSGLLPMLFSGMATGGWPPRALSKWRIVKEEWRGAEGSMSYLAWGRRRREGNVEQKDRKKSELCRAMHWGPLLHHCGFPYPPDRAALLRLPLLPSSLLTRCLSCINTLFLRRRGRFCI